jgi:hypothetical protein
MWNPTNATGVYLTVGATTGTYARITYYYYSLYSVTRSRYSNVVNTANQILGARNTELMYTRGSIALQGVSFLCQGRNGCLDQRRAPECTATTVVSADPCFKQHRRFCIDAGDLGAISFNKRNRCYKSILG